MTCRSHGTTGDDSGSPTDRLGRAQRRHDRRLRSRVAADGIHSGVRRLAFEDRGPARGQIGGVSSLPARPRSRPGRRCWTAYRVPVRSRSAASASTATATPPHPRPRRPDRARPSGSGAVPPVRRPAPLLDALDDAAGSTSRRPRRSRSTPARAGRAHRRRGARHLAQHGPGRGDGPRGRARARRPPARHPGDPRRPAAVPGQTPTRPMGRAETAGATTLGISWLPIRGNVLAASAANLQRRLPSAGPPALNEENQHSDISPRGRG